MRGMEIDRQIKSRNEGVIRGSEEGAKSWNLLKSKKDWLLVLHWLISP